MNSPKKKIENLKKKINNLQHYNESKSTPKKNSGVGFGFKISTEIVAALIVGVLNKTDDYLPKIVGFQ